MRTELFSKGELNAKAEIALMGRAVNITDKDNLAYVIDYICKVVKCTETSGAEILKLATQYSDEKVTRPIGLICNTIMGDMKCLTVILKTLTVVLLSLTVKTEYCVGYTTLPVPTVQNLGTVSLKRHPVVLDVLVKSFEHCTTGHSHKDCDLYGVFKNTLKIK